MNLKKPIWTEGLFVTQHHLQRQDRYHEGLLHERLHAAQAYPWGVTALEIDERALGNGQLRVRELVAVLADGTPIACSDAAGDVPPPRQIESAFPPHLSRLPVSVGIAHERDNAPNILPEERAAQLVRFVEQKARVTDFNTGTDEHDMAWARPTVRLLLGDENREAFDAIQIAELGRNPSGAIVLRESYVPPVLRVGASPYLVDRFRRVLTAMTSRQRSLMASRRQRTAAAIDFQASDVAKFWLLDALNESIPVITHVADHGTTHPEEAYLALARLIGRLCTMAVDGDPATLPKFNYLSLGEVFEPMFARALALIDTVIADRFTQIPLDRRDDGMHLGQVQDPTVLRQELFLSASSATIGEADIRDRLPKLSKIASWNQVGPLLNSALNGARLELEYRPPGALPIKPGVVIFRLHKTPEFWPDIQGTGTIALYHPLGPAIDLALYAVDPQNL